MSTLIRFSPEPRHHRTQDEPLTQPPSEAFTSHKDGIREHLLRKNGKRLTTGHPGLAKSYAEAADAIAERHRRNNEEGTRLEAAAKNEPALIAEAIACYQANVEERFVGAYPYERLRDIYAQQKAYQKAIDVCMAYVLMTTAAVKAGVLKSEECQDDEFIRWTHKLRAEMENG